MLGILQSIAKVYKRGMLNLVVLGMSQLCEYVNVFFQSILMAHGKLCIPAFYFIMSIQRTRCAETALALFNQAFLKTFLTKGQPAVCLVIFYIFSPSLEIYEFIKT